MASIGCAVGIVLFRYIDKHFYTDGFGTIGHHLAAAWGSTRDGVRDEYDGYADAGRKARSVFDRFRRGAGDDRDTQAGEDAAEDAANESTPGFDVVKPRPGRMRPDGLSTATDAGRREGRSRRTSGRGRRHGGGGRRRRRSGGGRGGRCRGRGPRSGDSRGRCRRRCQAST